MADLKRAIDRRRPRAVTEGQAAAISKVLAARPQRRISITAVLGDPEALQYATQLRQAIVAGGWQVEGIRESLFSQQIAGLLIFVGAEPPPWDANALFQTLRVAGLTVAARNDRRGVPHAPIGAEC